MSPEAPAIPWFVYIVLCRDGTLYTGITTDPGQRVKEHNRGKGCRYTSGRGPVELVYLEKQPDRSSALKIEVRIKRMSRRAKLALAGLSRMTPRSGC